MQAGQVLEELSDRCESKECEAARERALEVY
jgi:hypothetical protein